jgi:hypothetical protein
MTNKVIGDDYRLFHKIHNEQSGDVQEIQALLGICDSSTEVIPA